MLHDVVTTYLYESLYSDIYMKIPEGFKMPEASSSEPKELYSIKLQRSLYELKQSGRMWYNRLSEYLLKEEYVILYANVFLLRKQHPDSVLLMSMLMI